MNAVPCGQTYDEYQQFPNRVTALRMCLFIAEIFLNTTAVLTTFLFYSVLRRTCVLQKNPRRLLYNLLLSNVVIVTTR